MCNMKEIKAYFVSGSYKTLFTRSNLPESRKVACNYLKSLPRRRGL